MNAHEMPREISISELDALSMRIAQFAEINRMRKVEAFRRCWRALTKALEARAVASRAISVAMALRYFRDMQKTLERREARKAQQAARDARAGR
ncbi:MAG TPA: hypothetical protein VIU82_21955 [Bosea sp. (in: a-proteobacteria)]